MSQLQGSCMTRPDLHTAGIHFKSIVKLYCIVKHVSEVKR